MADQSEPTNVGGPAEPSPHDPKRILQFLAALLLMALVATQFQLTDTTLIGILIMALLLLLLALL